MADETDAGNGPQVNSATSETALTIIPPEVLLSDLKPESFKFREESVMLSKEHKPTHVEVELARLAVEAHRELQSVVPGEEALAGYIKVDLMRPRNTLMEVAFRVKPQGEEGPSYNNQIWLYRQVPLPQELKTYDYSGKEEELAGSEAEMAKITTEWNELKKGERTPEIQARLEDLEGKATDLEEKRDKLERNIVKMRRGKGVFYEGQQGVRQSVDEPSSAVFLNPDAYVYVVENDKPEFLGALKDLHALSVYGGEPKEGEGLKDWLKRDLVEVDQKLAREAGSDDDQEKLDFLKQKLADQKREKNRQEVDYVTDPRGRVDELLSQYQEWGVMQYDEPRLREPNTRSSSRPTLRDVEDVANTLDAIRKDGR